MTISQRLGDGGKWALPRVDPQGAGLARMLFSGCPSSGPGKQGLGLSQYAAKPVLLQSTLNIPDRIEEELPSNLAPDEVFVFLEAQ
jgi:hypothetical protein